ncbi:MAG: GbsR/MarR family transcriptional regulator [Planctomycetota bacterium]|jgi:predicted transcriptional regulator
MGGIDAREKQHLIEDVGMLFEDSGLPRMSGRVFGWLLISSPQHQTAGEIAAGLGASKGSMSTMLRMLAQFGMVERFGLPGERSAYYRVKPAYWVGMMQAKMGFIRRFHELAERALGAVDGSDPERTRRLEETRDFYHTFEKELTSIIERLSAGKAGDAVGSSRGSTRGSARKPTGGGR